MKIARMLVVCALGASSVISPLGCRSIEKAAREDPMKCERDPKCEKKRSGTADCSRQCNDDPACMSRCEQVQAPQRLGR